MSVETLPQSAVVGLYLLSDAVRLTIYATLTGLLFALTLPRYCLPYCLLFLLVCAASFGSRIVSAHEIRPAVADLITTDSEQISVTVLLNLEALMAEIGPQHSDTNESANSGNYQRLRALPTTQLELEFDRFRDEFLQAISITGDNDSRYPLTVDSLTIAPDDDLEIARDSVVTLVFTPRPDDTAVRWQWAEAFGEIIVRGESSTEEPGYAALLSPGQRSGPIALNGATEQPIVDVIWNYLVVGFEHILPKGWDHVLFIVALVLLSPRWKPLLLQVTAFTVAHSITLVLGASGWISVASSVVEPLIALSIVVVCLENIFLPKLGAWRVLLVFLFGLLHGLGFAGVLAEVGLDTANFIVALLAFNVGVEVGQLTVIFICLILFGWWLRDQPWYHRRVTVPVSLCIAAVGAWWFYERVDLSIYGIG